MFWFSRLAFRITPTRGIVRGMETLLDANQALSKDLPRNFLKLRHWQLAARLVLQAADSGAEDDIRNATDGLLMALLVEGWVDPDDECVVQAWQILKDHEPDYHSIVPRDGEQAELIQTRLTRVAHHSDDE